MHPDVIDQRWAPFPAEHFVRISARNKALEWCRAECRLAMPSPRWLSVLVALCVASIWMPLGVSLAFMPISFVLSRWSTLLDVRKYLSDCNRVDMDEIDAGNSVTETFPPA